MSAATKPVDHACYKPPSLFLGGGGGRGSFLPPRPRPNWKARKAEKRKAHRRNSIQVYEPPRLPELQNRNRLRASRIFLNRFKAPSAPLNTTTFIMRAKKSGGITSLVSPCPTTPAVIPTPTFSPAPRFRGGLADEVNEEWGVNGYGSMNGLIRLRSSMDRGRGDDESESDVDQALHAQSVQQLEQRLDQDLSRFEMIFPSSPLKKNVPNLLETRIDDQDSHIAHLEEENFTLKKRLFLMEQQLYNLRRRMHELERGGVSEEQAEVLSERSSGGASCACD